MNSHAMTESDFLESLADAIQVRNWNSEQDITSFALCWVALGRMTDENGEFLDIAVGLALLNAFHLFAIEARNDSDQIWEDFFDRVKEHTQSHNFGIPEEALSMSILQSCINLIEDLNDENRDHFFYGWCEHAADKDAMDALILTMSTIFGLLLLTFSEETKDYFSQELRELAHQPSDELSELRADDSTDEQQPIVVDETRQISRKTNSSRSKKPKSAKTQRQQQSQSGSKKKHSEKNWKRCYTEILAKRHQANLDNRARGPRRGKPFYSDAGADHLAEAIARALQMQPIPDGIPPRSWILSNPDQVVPIDASKVVFHVNATLSQSPQAAIKGRLGTMASYFPDVDGVRIFREKRKQLVSFDGELIEKDFAVVMYRIK